MSKLGQLIIVLLMVIPVLKLVNAQEVDEIPQVDLPTIYVMDSIERIVIEETTMPVPERSTSIVLGEVLVVPTPCTTWINCNPNPPNFDGVCCRICGEPGDREWECARVSRGELGMTQAEKDSLPFVYIGE
jgi:hypothetical protein